MDLFSVLVIGFNVVHVEVKFGNPKEWSKQRDQMKDYLKKHYHMPPVVHKPYLFKFGSHGPEEEDKISINRSVNMKEFDLWLIEMISMAKKATVDKKLALDFLLRSTLVLATSLQEIDSDGISCKLFVLR